MRSVGSHRKLPWPSNQNRRYTAGSAHHSEESTGGRKPEAESGSVVQAFPGTGWRDGWPLPRSYTYSRGRPIDWSSV